MEIRNVLHCPFCVVVQYFPRLQLCLPKKYHVTVQRMRRRREESTKPGFHSDMSASKSVAVWRTPTALVLAYARVVGVVTTVMLMSL